MEEKENMSERSERGKKTVKAREERARKGEKRRESWRGEKRR